ncbi:MAG: AzlC family ABC transporter permease, partial [Erysipelotrichaceae bacterium]|nr:AzlC family ABC transporter permease [Erysipelotrichaceae bacterium]
MKKETFKEALKDSLNILPGYIVLGTGFGVLLKAKGYGFLMCLFMSGLIYAGSMQYVGIDLLANGASLITTFFMTIMVNIRHLFYGVGMLKKYQDLKRHKLYNIFALTDETFSIVCNKEVEDEDHYFFLSILNHSYWITGSLIGNVLGDILPFNYTG